MDVKSGESLIWIESANTNIPPGSRTLKNSFNTLALIVLGNSWNK